MAAGRPQGRARPARGPPPRRRPGAVRRRCARPRRDLAARAGAAGCPSCATPPGALAGRRRAGLPAGAGPQGGPRRAARRARAPGAGGRAAGRRAPGRCCAAARRAAGRPRRAAAAGRPARWTGWCCRSSAAVAAALGLADADDLLRAVAEAGRTVAFAVDTAWRQVDGELAARRTRWPGCCPAAGRGPAAPRRPLADGVVEQDGEVVLARDADPWADPALSLRVAAAAARAGLPLAPHALDWLAPSPRRCRRRGRRPARDAFVDLLGTGPAAVPVLGGAATGPGCWSWLSRSGPGCGRRPQHNPVHRFTVDRHLIEAAAEAAALTRDGGPARPAAARRAAARHRQGLARRPHRGRRRRRCASIAAAARPAYGRRRDRRRAGPPAPAAAGDGHPARPGRPGRPSGRGGRCRTTSATCSTCCTHWPGPTRLATGPAAWSEWKGGWSPSWSAGPGTALAGAPPPAPPALTAAQRELAADRRAWRSGWTAGR